MPKITWMVVIKKIRSNYFCQQQKIEEWKKVTNSDLVIHAGHSEKQNKYRSRAILSQITQKTGSILNSDNPCNKFLQDGEKIMVLLFIIQSHVFYSY